MVCHAPATAVRLGVDRFPAFDVLELFAFVYPATFALPTVAGLARFLGLTIPKRLDDQPAALREAARTLLAHLARIPELETKVLAGVAGAMTRGGWLWGPPVLAALGAEVETQKGYGPAAGL